MKPNFHRVLLLSAAGALCAGVALGDPVPAGIPDFSTAKSFTGDNGFFHPVAGEKYKPINPPEDHPYCANKPLRICGYSQLPAFGDYNNPVLRPETARQLKMIDEAVLAGDQVKYYQAMARCWPGGVPGIMAFAAQPFYFLQGPKEVTMLWSRGPNIRHVYLNVEHTKNPALSWYGESVGHYDGKKLVIDTIGENDKSATDFFHTPHSNKIHVVETYSIEPEGEFPTGNDGIIKRSPVLRGAFTVDDPVAFVAPFSGWIDYVQGYTPLSDSESICAENNDANYFNEAQAPIPQTTRPDF